jgi:hypothetical protein
MFFGFALGANEPIGAGGPITAAYRRPVMGCTPWAGAWGACAQAKA